MANELLSTRYLYALELTAQLFDGRKREVAGMPFVTHLFGVAHIVQQLTDDEDVHIAALLHDTLEDIPAEDYSAEQMQADFGLKILKLVQTVSYDEVRYEKDESRRQYVRQLEAGAKEACLISGADMLHNGRDFIYWYQQNPQALAAAFGGERAKRRAWFWHERMAVIESRLGADYSLVRELHGMFRKLDPIHQKIM